MGKQLTQEEFILKSRKLHRDKYDYSLANYTNALSKVNIICPIHGVFEQKAFDHYSKGHGCPYCSITKRSNSKKFIEKAKLIHGDKYDYSLVDYKNNKKKVKLICPIHGIFEIRPNNILSGAGCNNCGNDRGSRIRRLPLEKYIKRANKVHNFRYDYSLVELKSIETITKIICPTHGIFEQNFNNHLKGFGCKLCSNNVSAGELQLKHFISEIYNGKIISNSRQIIKPKELDIYLPDLKLAFEYDGEYWHSLREQDCPGYHELKNKACLEKGIKLIHISDKDWMNNSDLIKDKIKKIIKHEKN